MTTLEIICLYGLGISLCLLLFDAAGKTLRAAWRRNGRRYGVAASLIGLAVVCTINAQKPGPTPVITVDSFLADAGSYATNDVLHVAVTNAPAYAGIDFSSCPVLVYARPRGLSDAPEWEELLPRRTFSELPADYAIEDATNYNYLVYLDYVPPSPVHTNGVFELRGFVIDGMTGEHSFASGFINSRAVLDVPYDSEVEYLESTGTQWIDTETKPSEDLATYITFSYQQIANNVSAFGSRSNSTVNDRYWLNYDGKFEIGYGNWGSAVETTSVGAINTIAFNEIVDGNHTFTVNGRSITFSGTPNTTVNIIAFGRVVGSTAPVLSKMRLYSMSMKRGGVLIHDYIPVRVGTTGELYDRVSGTLATRHGDFQYGSDIEQASCSASAYTPAH